MSPGAAGPARPATSAPTGTAARCFRSPAPVAFIDWDTAAPGRARLVETVLWWQDRCRRGIEEQAAAGDPAMARLRDLGAPRPRRATSSRACDVHRQ